MVDTLMQIDAQHTRMNLERRLRRRAKQVSGVIAGGPKRE
jgi:hypothetical protein